MRQISSIHPATRLENFLSTFKYKAVVRTLGDPVKESSLKRGSVVNRSAPSREQGRTLKAPLGRCGADDSTSAIISAPIGVRDAGFITKGHLRVPSDVKVCS